MKIPVRKFLSPAFFTVVLTFCLNSFAQVSEKTLIKGLVLDALTGYPIPYASVFLKGTSVGTLTDANGKYLLESGLRSDTISFHLSDTRANREK
ncbi:MAG: carboxypeptidase-like regulatory domain-containing protein [Bacteroidales bacterium]|nr:carboxypeptidase-like regulatory domain-containing protein [Bacteroidales bacterium]